MKSGQEKSKPDFYKKIQAGKNAWKVVIEQLEQQAKDIKELKDKVAELEGGQSE